MKLRRTKQSFVILGHPVGLRGAVT